MAVGKQAETVITQWHPGDTNGTDGTGINSVSSPTASNDTTDELAAEAAAEAASLIAAKAYTDVLHTRLVASGVLPV